MVGGPSPLSVPSPPPAEADWEPTAGGLDLARGTHTQSVMFISPAPDPHSNMIVLKFK